MRVLTFLFLPTVLALTACGGAAPAQTGKPVIEIDGAFIVKPPEGRDLTGGGLTVTVTGEPVRLTGARTVAARSVEMHTMTMEDNMMQMRQVESFPVSEEAPLVLERGGNHLMLFGVGPIETGSKVDLILTFTDESGNSQDIVAEADIVPPGG